MKKLIISLLAALISACSDIESDMLTTQDMNFSMSLQNKTSSSWECYTRVSNNQGSNVILVDGDKLTCNGVRMRLKSSSIGNYQFYTAIVPVRDENRYTITFYRDGKELANSSITPPSDIVLESPQYNFNLGPNDLLTILYQPSQIHGELNQTQLSFADPAENNSSPSVIYSLSQTNLATDGKTLIGPFSAKYSTLPKKNLPLTLTLSRASKGKVDSKIRGSFDATTQAVVYGTYMGTKQ